VANNRSRLAHEVQSTRGFESVKVTAVIRKLVTEGLYKRTKTLELLRLTLPSAHAAIIENCPHDEEKTDSFDDGFVGAT
jgi:hypothetical protein